MAIVHIKVEELNVQFTWQSQPLPSCWPASLHCHHVSVVSCFGKNAFKIVRSPLSDWEGLWGRTLNRSHVLKPHFWYHQAISYFMDYLKFSWRPAFGQEWIFYSWFFTYQFSTKWEWLTKFISIVKHLGLCILGLSCFSVHLALKNSQTSIIPY